MKALRFFAAFAAAAALFACKPDDQPDGGQTGDVKISASPATVTFNAEGGTIKVAVSTDKYQVEGAAEWLTASANGKELELNAGANDSKEARSCTLTLTAGTSSCKVEVSQKAGSGHAGYKLAESVTCEYGGASIYFIKPITENYGGSAFLSVTTEDDNFSIMFYTALFASEEEVELTPGTYTAGEDDYSAMTLYAVPGTFCIGVDMNIGDEDGESEMVPMGTYVTSNTSGAVNFITGGEFKIEKAGDSYTIILDLAGADGTVYKVVYEGAVEIEIPQMGGVFPGEVTRIDPTENIFKAVLTHTPSEDGTELCELSLYAGESDEECAMSVFSFNVAKFNADDLSGAWIAMAADGDDDDEDEVDAVSEEDEDEAGDGDEGDWEMPEYGTANLGIGMEIMPGFILPIGGSYVVYGPGDVAIADQMVSVNLARNENGSYVFNGVLMGGDMMHMYLNKVINIVVSEASDEDED